MATFKVVGKFQGGETLSGNLAGQSAFAVAQEVQRNLPRERPAESLARLTIIRLEGDTALRIAKPRKRADKGGDGATPAKKK